MASAQPVLCWAVEREEQGMLVEYVVEFDEDAFLEFAATHERCNLKVLAKRCL